VVENLSTASRTPETPPLKTSLLSRILKPTRRVSRKASRETQIPTAEGEQVGVKLLPAREGEGSSGQVLLSAAEGHGCSKLVCFQPGEIGGAEETDDLPEAPRIATDQREMRTHADLFGKERESLDGELPLEELTAAVKQTSSGKTENSLHRILLSSSGT